MVPPGQYRIFTVRAYRCRSTDPVVSRPFCPFLALGTHRESGTKVCCHCMGPMHIDKTGSRTCRMLPDIAACVRPLPKYRSDREHTLRPFSGPRNQWREQEQSMVSLYGNYAYQKMVHEWLPPRAVAEVRPTDQKGLRSTHTQEPGPSVPFLASSMVFYRVARRSPELDRPSEAGV